MVRVMMVVMLLAGAARADRFVRGRLDLLSDRGTHQVRLPIGTEAFDAIEQSEPRFAITNEALLMRRWIEN